MARSIVIAHETMARAAPRALQRLLTEAPWVPEPVIDRLQAYVGARLNTPEGVFVLDESGFPKQGQKSVGVARQYCGMLGNVGHCQRGVFLAYVSARGLALVDKRLYLPPAWSDDPARCQAAGVPVDEMRYQSKAALGLALMARQRARGVEHEHRRSFEVATRANASSVVRIRRTTRDARARCARQSS